MNSTKQGIHKANGDCDLYPGAAKPALNEHHRPSHSVALEPQAQSWRRRAVVLAALLLPATVLAGPWIWWEGENTSSNNFPASTWLSASSQADSNVLSAGNMLTVDSLGPGCMYWANYNVPVAQAGTYRLYGRRTWEYAPFKWQFDNGAWQYAGDQLALLDNVNYRPYWPLNWIFLGTVTMSAGPHVFRIVLSAADWPGDGSYSSPGHCAGFDAFVLTTDPYYIPRGKLQPGQKYNLAEPGQWDFEPGIDEFTSAALLDLRSLNETVAGQSGYVHLAADQSGKFVLGDGTPVRFWGANLGLPSADLGSLTTQARFLAKRGVNVVRYLDNVAACDPANINAVNTNYVDNAQRIVAAFKQAGIYTELNFFYPFDGITPFTICADWGVPGFTNDVTGQTAVMMFDETLKAAYKQWATQLFTAPSPYTGIALGQDPALAVIELQNEDGFFFWTFNPDDFPEAQRQNLETEFGSWLIAKYGSIAAAQANWASWDTQPDDDPADGRMGLMSAYFMTSQPDADWSRMPDEIAFLSDLQHAFYQEMGDFLRNTLGCQSLISPGNWYTADDDYLLDVERYTYTTNPVINAHPYFAAPSSGSGVSVGTCYQSLAVVNNPRMLPSAYKQVAGYANIASESTWDNPNRFKAEGPLLTAAYNSLVDLDGWIWECATALGYDDNAASTPVDQPSIIGQFPGAALLYRRGDVQTQLAVRNEVNLNRASQKEFPLISQYSTGENPPYSPAYDPATGTGRLDPLALLAGRVECDFVTQDESNYVAPNLFACLDATNQIVESLPPPGATNGQLELNWSNGVFQVNTPCSQGACGFLNSTPSIALDDVTIFSSNQFGAVLVVSMDGLPLAQSQKILVQAMTEDNPYGWEDQDAVFTNNSVVYTGKQIVSIGQPPMNVVNIAGAVTLKGLGQGRSFRVLALDENGYASGAASSHVSGADLQVTLPPNSLYTMLVDVGSFVSPALTNQPQSLTVAPGSNVVFSVSATGTQPLIYQWQFNGAPLAGATDPSLTLANVTAAQNGNYFMVVTNLVGSVTSATAVLTVTAPPVITQQPQNQVTNPGVNVTISVTAAGAGPLAYQWLFDGTSLAGATAPSLILTNAQPVQGGVYSVIVTNQFGSVLSSNAVLVVGLPYGYTDVDVGKPSHHGSATIGFDTAGQELITVNGGGNDIWNASDNFNFYYTSRTGPFDCRVRVRSLTGPDWWSKAELMARESTAAGARFFANMTTQTNGQNQIWVQWRDTTGGQAASPSSPTPTINPNYPECWLRLQRVGNVLYASYSGDGTNWNRYYTWNTATLSAGHFASTLSVGLAVTAHNDTDTNGATAVLSDFQFDPMITGQPQGLTVVAGNQAILGVAATGASPLSYQWWFNSAALTGATNATLTLTNAQASQAGTYWVVVSDAAGSVSSANAVLTVNSPAMIALQPQSQTVTAGATALFTVVATGDGPLGYQWQFNGVDLSDDASVTGSSSASLTLLNVRATNAGSYQVLVTNAYGSVTSAPATLTVLPATPALIWSNPPAITYGTALGPSQLNATATVPGTFAYSPAAGTVLNAGTNSLSVVFTPNDALDYDSSSASVGVVVQKAPLTATAGSATRIYGAPNPVFTGTLVGLVNGDAITAVCTCAATATSLPGSYPIVPSLVDTNSRLVNYAVTLVNGTLVVTAATPPTLTSITPNIGLTNGGETITILGSGFESGATVAFGTNAATTVDFINSTNLTVLTPPSVPGTVDVVLTNADGQVATLTNGFTYGQQPFIISQPTNQTALFETAVEFAVQAGGTGPLDYQWQFDGVNLTDGGAITGSQSNLLGIAEAAMGNSGSYSVVMTNAYGSVTSAPATLTVLPATPAVLWSNPPPIIYGTALGSSQLNATATVPGTFAYSPAAGTVLNAGTNSLSVVFTPDDALDYDSSSASVGVVVQKAPLTATAGSATRIYGAPNPVFTGTLLGLVNGDAITEAYACAATPTSLPGSYPVVPSLVDPNNRLNNYAVTLVDGMLTVTPAAPPILLSVTPNTGSTSGGDTVTILGTGFESGATVTFGATMASTVESIDTTNLVVLTPPSAAGSVNVVLTNADGQSATLTNGFTYVAPAGTSPSLALQPTNQVVGLGAGAVFAATAAGTPPLTYQWQFNGTNLADNGRIFGSSSNLLSIGSAALSDAGAYQVVITNGFGSATSATAMLTIVAPPRLGATEQTGATLTFTWGATAGQPYQVQYTTNLSQPDWVNLTVVTATNSTATGSDVLSSAAQRFYRVIWLP